jgi:hypothetical protein
MVEATDELRERLWDWADQILDLWNIEDTNPPSLTEGFADLLLPLVVAVVAEARTEGAIAELEYLSADTAKTLQVWTPSDLNERAAALRGVGNQKVGVTVDDLALDEMDGNQNAEPRWSANRLEEVLREGLPDQNAEPEAER